LIANLRAANCSVALFISMMALKNTGAGDLNLPEAILKIQINKKSIIDIYWATNGIPSIVKYAL
jgi:hypothetical protein